MSFLLKRTFLVSFAPGFLFLIGVVAIHKQFCLLGIWELGKSLTWPLGIGIVVLSFIVGQIFDSFRDGVIETLYERWYKKYKKKDIDWYYFSEASPDNIQKLDDNFYIWYDLNWNLAICMFVLILLIGLNFMGWLTVKKLFTEPLWIVILLAISIIILLRDACCLRSDIIQITQKDSKNNGST